MIISYCIKSEGGEEIHSIGEYKSVEELSKELMDNIEYLYPVCEYSVVSLNTSKEDEKLINKVVQEFYDFSWKYGMED